MNIIIRLLHDLRSKILEVINFAVTTGETVSLAVSKGHIYQNIFKAEYCAQEYVFTRVTAAARAVTSWNFVLTVMLSVQEKEEMNHLKR